MEDNLPVLFWIGQFMFTLAINIAPQAALHLDLI